MYPPIGVRNAKRLLIKIKGDAMTCELCGTPFEPQNGWPLYCPGCEDWVEWMKEEEEKHGPGSGTPIG